MKEKKNLPLIQSFFSFKSLVKQTKRKWDWKKIKNQWNNQKKGKNPRKRHSSCSRSLCSVSKSQEYVPASRSSVSFCSTHFTIHPSVVRTHFYDEPRGINPILWSTRAQDSGDSKRILLIFYTAFDIGKEGKKRRSLGKNKKILEFQRENDQIFRKKNFSKNLLILKIWEKSVFS